MKKRPPKRLRVTLVGASSLAAMHARCIRAYGAEIAAVVDPDIMAARRLASSLGSCRVFDQVEACLQGVQSDMVHICEADRWSEIAAIALSKEANVLVEPPVIERVHEIQRLLEKAAAEELRLGACFRHRYLPGFRGLLSAREKLGDPRQIAVSWCLSDSDVEIPDRQRLIAALPEIMNLLDRLLGPEIEMIGWRIHWLDSGLLHLVGDWQTCLVRITIDCLGRPLRKTLRYMGTRGSWELDLLSGLGFPEVGGPGIWARTTVPLRTGWLRARRYVKETTRLIASQPDPGLRAAIHDFYHSLGQDTEHDWSREFLLPAQWLERLEAQGALSPVTPASSNNPSAYSDQHG